jgi:hypothetical protein
VAVVDYRSGGETKPVPAVKMVWFHRRPNSSGRPPTSEPAVKIPMLKTVSEARSYLSLLLGT